MRAPVASLLPLAVTVLAGCLTVPPLPPEQAAATTTTPLTPSVAHGEYAIDDEAAVVSHTVETLLRLVALKHALTDIAPRAPRDVHAKQHGCANATLRIDADVPAELRQGLFATPATYSAIVRFSTSEPGPHGDDWDTSLKGMAVKVFGVHGDRFDVAGDDEEDTQDFAFNNRPSFPLRDVRDYGDAMQVRLDRYRLGPLADAAFAVTHLDRLPRLVMDTNRIMSPLSTTYWSQTPLAVGTLATKMAFRPCRLREAENTPPTVRPASYGRDVLKSRVRETLASSSSCYDVMVQVRPADGSEAFPIEDASVVWSEAEAPMVRVARLTLPAQPIDALDVAGRCESLHFNVWHSLKAHRPLGSLNRSRRIVYDALASYRQKHTTTSATSSSSPLPPTAVGHDTPPGAR